MSKQTKVYTGRIASTVLLGVALFLCSVSTYVLLGASSSIHNLVGTVNLSVEVLDTAKVDSRAISELLEQIEGVSSVSYIDSDQAQRDFSDFIGSDITKYAGEGVLPSTFLMEIEATHAEVDSLNDIKLKIGEFGWVDGIFHQSAVAEGVVENLSTIERFAGYFAWIFGLCTLLLGYLSTRISVGALCNAYGRSKYKEIFRSSIRWAVVQGLLSALIAIGMLYFTVSYTQITMPHLEFTSVTLPLIASGIVVVATLATLIFTLIAILIQRLR